MSNKRIFFVALCLWLQLALGSETQPVWKISLGGESAGSPALDSGSAIVAVKNGTLCALDGAGKLLWKQMLPGGCLAAPAVARNGDIYVAGAAGSLFRVSAAGKILWKTGLGPELRATPLLAAETLFQAGADGTVFKVRLSDGIVLKKIELRLPLHSSPVWDAGRQILLVPVKDGFLFALDQELQVLWKFKTVGVNLSAPAVTPKNEIYLTSMDHSLYKLTGNGALLWKYKAKAWLKASPVMDEKGRVYFGSYDRFFYAVDMDGKSLWQFRAKASFTATAAIDAAGNIYCGDTSGTVYALDSRGALLWQYKSDDFITSDLTITPQGMLLAGSIDGTLLAFQIGQPLSQKAWWAKYLGNLSNSGFDEQ